MRVNSFNSLFIWYIIALYGISGHLVAAQFAVPPPPLWSFSVRSADSSSVMIIFAKDYVSPTGQGPFSIGSYRVEKSASVDFSQFNTLPSSGYLDTGTAFMTTDVGYSGSAGPYYRVRILSNSGQEVSSSLPLQPVDQAGNVFVVNNPTAPSGPSCGDLATNPCNDITTAIATATSGSTVYVTPGIYTGPGNTNLTYAGKAITVASTNGFEVTMINCTDPSTGTSSRAFNFISGEKRDSVLSGFTIANGNQDYGGCVSIIGSSPTITGSMFLACNATTGVSQGGAIYASAINSPGPLIQNTQFIFNWGVEGGAIYVGGDAFMDIEGCFFEWGICPTGNGRGGAVCAVLANITVKDSIMKNGIVGFGGGGIMLERGSAVVSGLTVNNNTAGNFGGAFLLFGSQMIISDSSITGNSGNIFAGGVILTSAIYDATNTTHENNFGRVGGGGIKVVGGQLKMKGCTVNNNYASYGAGFDIAKQGDLSTMYCSVLVEDTEVMNNAVPDRGAGFYLDSFDSLTFRNVRFKNNTATKGGGGWCVSSTSASFINTTFEENTAQYGGGLFTDAPCNMNLTDSTFRKNTAVEAGAGLATGDGVVLNIIRTIFDSNGVSDCIMSQPPTSGGGLMIGVEQFKVNGECGASTAVIPTNVTIQQSSFVGNVVRSKGGAINLEAGNLFMDGVDIEGNSAIGTANTPGDGLGGGLAVIERCPDNSPCSQAIGIVANTTFLNNDALSAGGGLHFAGGSEGGGLQVLNSNFSSNTVAMGNLDAGNPNNENSVGGGMYLGRSNFTLSDIAFASNIAYFGGAMFLSANLSSTGARFSQLTSINDKAFLGSTAYWLRSASPDAELPLDAFTITPQNANASVATEVLSSAFSSPPPSTLQSAEAAPTFSVSLLDYYGNVGISELGTCDVQAPPSIASANSNDTVTIRPLGSDSGVTQGGAVFSQVEVTGTIGKSYNLSVVCTPNSLGRSIFLNVSGKSLPPLSFPVVMAPCAAGKEPKSTGDGSICVDCPYNSFNFDGEACQPCPKGALCTGGAEISSQANWWRSNYTSEIFYSCRTPDVCEAGHVAGNDACVQGHEGPLCAVCQHDYFFFGGRCKACNNNGQARAMLAFTVIIIIVIVIALFAWSWDFGDPAAPGIMTKVKILLTHLQLLALFKDYDVLWPSVTENGFAWFDTFNIGVSMMAPECFMAYSFWVKWIFQMLLPVGAVAMSGLAYYGAVYALLRIKKNHGFAVHKDIATSNDDGDVSTRSDGTDRKNSIFKLKYFHRSLSSSTRNSTLNSEELSLLNENSRKWAVYFHDLKIRSWRNAFWLVTLIYPRSSMTALQMFGTETLDIGTYLTADFSIQIKPPGGDYTNVYVRYIIPGAIMLIIFAIGIPGVWFWITWKHRHNLDDELVAKKYGFLYGSYSRKYPYWEAIETFRKFILALIPVFIPVNSVGSVQGTVGQIVCIFFLIVSISLHPFALPEDNHIHIASQIVLLLVLLSGSTAKWADINQAGLTGLAALQLITSSALAFTCVTLIVFAIRKIVREYRSKKGARSLGDNDHEEGADSKEKKKRFENLRNIFAIHVRVGGSKNNDEDEVASSAGNDRIPSAETVSIDRDRDHEALEASHPIELVASQPSPAVLPEESQVVRETIPTSVPPTTKESPTITATGVDRRQEVKPAPVRSSHSTPTMWKPMAFGRTGRVSTPE